MKQNKAKKTGKGNAVTKKEEVIVLSVGGSLIVPDDIDAMFLSTFRDLILKGVRAGKRFVIITGGGRLCRQYQNAARVAGSKSEADADWMGIDATRINARLIKSILAPHAEEHIIQSPLEKFVFKKPVVVGGGWKPGFSSDYDAVLLAKRFKAKKLVNLSNIDYVYTSDPRINAAAEKIESIKWKDFRKLLPKKWTPGLSSPFDPIASREAEKLKLQVAVINGKKLHELDKYIAGESFIGTLIS